MKEKENERVKPKRECANPELMKNEKKQEREQAKQKMEIHMYMV